MKEVDCRRCKNCTGTECKLYGDDPVKAARNCAHDRFREYTPIAKKKRPGRKRAGSKEGGSHGIDGKHHQRTGV